MERNNWKQYAFIFAIIGSALYIILTFIGMMFYTGGNRVNNNEPGYNFFYNYFSDLGRTKSYSGQDNTVSMILYIIATGVFGLSLIPFSIAFRDFFKETNESLSKKGTIFGLLAGVCTFVYAVTPYDISPLFRLFHGLFVLIAYPALGVMGIMYSKVMLKSDYPKPYPRIFVSLFVIYFIGLSLNFFGSPFLIRILGQKIHKYATMICFIIQGYGAWKLETSGNP